MWFCGLAPLLLLIPGFILLVLQLVLYLEKDGECDLTMFKNNSEAFRACQAQYALQQNWFPDPIQGLFSYQTWNGMDGFWQNGIAVESMANSMFYMNNTRYKSVVMNSYRSLDQLLLAYGPQPSYDDMAWYGLAYARVFEITGEKKFLELSFQIFEWIWSEGWDTSICNGGVWFDQSQSGKQTIENVQMIQLAAKLSRLLKKPELKSKANTVMNWVVKVGLINKTSYEVYDGISLETCERAGDTKFTYTAGTTIGGLVELTKLTGNTSFLALAHNVSISVLNTMTLNNTLMEPCDRDASCNLDQQIFKGIFMRNLKYLIGFDANSSFVPEYNKFIEANIETMFTHASCTPGGVNSTTCHIIYLDGSPYNSATGPVFDSVWSGPFHESRPIQQTSALDLLLAGIQAPVECVGKKCEYDPAAPPPHHLTCEDDPCPVGQDCCEYEEEYACCNTDQKCQDGICL